MIAYGPKTDYDPRHPQKLGQSVCEWDEIPNHPPLPKTSPTLRWQGPTPKKINPYEDLSFCAEPPSVASEKKITLTPSS